MKPLERALVRLARNSRRGAMPGEIGEHRASASRSEGGLDPVHVRAQLRSHVLDLGVRLLGAHPLEVLLAGTVLRDPLARKVARLDLREDLAHILTCLLCDY